MGVDPSVAALGEDELAYLSSTLRDLIGRRIDGIAYAETRRTQLALIGGALAAVGVALLPLSTVTLWPPLQFTYLVAGTLAIAVGLVVWVLFAAQTNFKYSFVDPAQTWKWFYWHALPNATKFGPKWHTRQNADAKAAEQAEHLRQRGLFFNQVAGLSDAKIDATQDLRQLYLLHINERFKNLFLTDLRRVLVRGVQLVPMSTVATLVIASAVWFLWGSQGPSSSNEVVHSGVTIHASWSPTGFVRNAGISEEDIEFRFVLTITNNRKTSFGGRLVAEDRAGKAIPAEFDASAVRVGPIGTLRDLGHFWIAAADRSAFAKIDVP
jgi:hypothetical protein